MRFANPLKKTRTIASKLGHVIEFPGREGDKMTFVRVPDLLVPECIAAGLATEDEIPEADENKGPTKPLDPAQVKSQMDDAFEVLVKTAAREDFTAAGSPKREAVQKIVGWEVDNATLKDAWKAYQQEQAEAAKG